MTNKFSFVHKGNKITLKPLTPRKKLRKKSKSEKTKDKKGKNDKRENILISKKSIKKVLLSKKESLLLWPTNMYLVLNSPLDNLPPAFERMLGEFKVILRKEMLKSTKLILGQVLLCLTSLLARQMSRSLKRYKDRLTNPPSTFMRLMNHVLRYLIGKYMVEKSQALKEGLTNAPILALPNFSKIFELECDASNMGVEAILLQEGNPITYFSEKLTNAQINFSTYDKELYALVRVFQVWQHYLLPKEFVVHSDHEALKHLKSQNNLSKRHGHSLLSMLETKLLGFEHLKELYLKDEFFKEMIFSIMVQMELFIYIMIKQMCVPKISMRGLLVKKAHEGNLMGHFEEYKTFAKSKVKPHSLYTPLPILTMLMHMWKGFPLHLKGLSLGKGLRGSKRKYNTIWPLSRTKKKAKEAILCTLCPVALKALYRATLCFLCTFIAFSIHSMNKEEENLKNVRKEGIELSSQFTHLSLHVVEGALYRLWFLHDLDGLKGYSLFLVDS
ncbi:Retrovirus-related Pol polyprotein, partial [Mucuna pruriens]